MRLCNSWIPEEHLMCYQTSQCNWVIIKMFYRYLRRCLLGWHRSRLGFVTLCFGEVSLGPLTMLITISLASNVTNELVAGWCITEWVKRLTGNEIEQGMMILTIESRASNIPMTKGITYVVIEVWLIKIFVEYVGTNMSIQVPHWLLTGDVSRSCLQSSRTWRVRTLNVLCWFVLWVMWFDERSLFGVPDEIRDMTRSLEMAER